MFFQPYRAHFSAQFGRPSIPIETYLRMMFLKHRYRLGYETLCREVADSLSWSRFCRVPLGCTVPHPSTLEKITTRCGPETIAQLNRALLVKAGAAKVVRLDKVRADTTVVAANVAYPTDSGLLVRAITLLTMLVALIHTAGGATRTKVRDRRRAAGRRARSISAHLKLRNDEAKTRVLAITGELADLADATAVEAARCWSTPDAGSPARVGGFRAAGRGGRRAGAHPGPHRAGHHPDPVPAGRGDAGLGQPAGQPARPGRPPDREGPAGQAGGVRLQGARSSTTSTGSCSTTACTRATRPTRRCWPRRSTASRPCSAAACGR